MSRDRIWALSEILLCSPTSHQINSMNRHILRAVATAVSLLALSSAASAETTPSQASALRANTNAFQLFDVKFDANRNAAKSFSSAVLARRTLSIQTLSGIDEIGGGTCTAACLGWAITSSTTGAIPYIRVDLQCSISIGPIFYNYQGLFNASYAFMSCTFPTNSEYVDFDTFAMHGWSLDGVGYDGAYTYADAHI